MKHDTKNHSYSSVYKKPRTNIAPIQKLILETNHTLEHLPFLSVIQVLYFSLENDYSQDRLHFTHLILYKNQLGIKYFSILLI